MKNLLALVAVLGLLSPILAAGATGSTPPLALLDHDEQAQLMKVRGQVLAAHPDLKAEEEKLKQMHEAQTKPATPDQVQSAQAEWQAYQTKLRAEMLKIDPTLKPIFAKLDKARAKIAAEATPPPPAPVKTDRD